MPCWRAGCSFTLKKNWIGITRKNRPKAQRTDAFRSPLMYNSSLQMVLHKIYSSSDSSCVASKKANPIRSIDSFIMLFMFAEHLLMSDKLQIKETTLMKIKAGKRSCECAICSDVLPRIAIKLLLNMTKPNDFPWKIVEFLHKVAFQPSIAGPLQMVERVFLTAGLTNDTIRLVSFIEAHK